MTWAKLSDDFGEDCARAGLSDAAFRTHVEGLLWTMRRETGGRLDRRDLDRFAETTDRSAAAAELVAAGFWRQTPSGWHVEHHMTHQPEPDLLDARRAQNAERQRRHRRRRAGVDEVEEVSRRDETRDGHRDKTRDPGRVGTGRDGPGKRAPTEGRSAMPEATSARSTSRTRAREAGSPPGVVGAAAGASSPADRAARAHVPLSAEAEDPDLPSVAEDPRPAADALDLDDGEWSEPVAVPGAGRRREWVPS